MSWLMLFAPAHAFAPTDDVWIGVEPARVFQTHTTVQNRLRHQPDWVEFTAGEGAGWQARFDERTGAVHRAMGPGIDLGPLPDAKAVEVAVRKVLARHAGLVGVGQDQLAIRDAKHVARTDTWYVDFDRLVDGLPVWRAGVTARVVGGKLVMLGLDTYPALLGVGDPKIADVDAIAAARKLGPAPLAQHTDESAELTVLPVDVPGGVAFRLCWLVRSRTQDPPGKWVSFVDARTGALVNVYNEVRFLTGTISGLHDTRTVNGDTSVDVMPLIGFTSSSGTSASALSDGTFSLTDGLSWTSKLRGDWLSVRNASGDNGSLTVSDAAPVWTTSAATEAEIDSYVFLHQVRDWALLIAPDVAIVDDAMRSNVNMDSTCNAYYDGAVNFYEEGDGCANTGRIADVNYHEWGHGFHAYSVESGTVDGTMGEGIGDVMAMLQTLDPEIAPYFYSNGAPIRELETDRVYPDDVVGEVHEDGLIYGGAMWDLYTELLDTYGEDGTTKGTAWTVTSNLYAASLKGGPTLDTIYDEMVLADATYGSTHLCEITDAFGLHGLGPGGSAALVSLDHEGLGNQDPGVEPPVAGEMVNLAPACNDFTLSTVDAMYSTDGGQTWDTAPLDVNGDGFEGNLPAFEDGTVVEYYLSAQASDGTEILSPPGGDIAPYTFYVGALEELYCEDFEADDGGYTHELVSGDDRRGADDWIWGTPTGMGGDPSAAYSGTKVWGNDLGGGDYNGEYQPDVVNRLTSPSIDVGDADTVVVQFRRWLSVEDGYYDVATVYANDEAIWQNHASNRNAGDEHTEDADWMLHTDVVPVDGGALTLAWEIDSDGGLEKGGWNVDDVCVYKPIAAPPDTGGSGDDTGATTDSGNPDDLGQNPDDGDKVELNGGCGCDGAAGAGSVSGVALALLSLVRLRRGG